MHDIHSHPKELIATLLALLVSAASALSGSVTLELSGGSVIKGDLISWNGQQAVVKAEFGPMTFKRDQLNQATIQRLDLRVLTIVTDRIPYVAKDSHLEIKDLSQGFSESSLTSALWKHRQSARSSNVVR